MSTEPWLQPETGEEFKHRTANREDAATVVYKRIASLIADKQRKPYSKTLHWLRCRLSFRFSVQQSRGFKGQDHQSTALATHPLPPWRWPVLRVGSHPIFENTACKATPIWHGLSFFASLQYAWFIVRNHLIWKNDQHEYKFMILWYALAHILQQFRHFSDYTATYISEGSIHWWRWLHSHQNVWMTAYQKVMTDLPSHSGLYKWV